MTDAERLGAILDLLEKRGVQASLLVVGDIKIALASPWPGPRPAPERPVDVQAAEVLSSKKPDEWGEREWAAVRRASKVTFGRILPDEQLRGYAEAGLL